MKMTGSVVPPCIVIARLCHYGFDVSRKQGVVHLNKTGICILIAVGFILFLYVVTKKDSANEKVVVDQISLKKALQEAIRAAEDGGREVVAASRDNLNIRSKGKTKEGLDESVTNADLRSHCVMAKRIGENLKKVGFVSEEAKTDCGKDVSSVADSKGTDVSYVSSDEWVDVDNVQVWIDPLDATQEYTEKLNEYVTTMVCVVVNGKPVIGVIHKPFYNETYWAWVGHERSKNLEETNTKKEEGFKFITSRSHTGDVKNLIESKYPEEKVKIITAGGAGYKVLEVTKGNADAYVHVTAIKKWDICAGNAIINAVGGKMMTRYGEEIDYGTSLTVVNEDGLIVTLKNHQKYLNSLFLKQ